MLPASNPPPFYTLASRFPTAAALDASRLPSCLRPATDSFAPRLIFPRQRTHKPYLRPCPPRALVSAHHQDSNELTYSNITTISTSKNALPFFLREWRFFGCINNLLYGRRIHACPDNECFTVSGSPEYGETLFCKLLTTDTINRTNNGLNDETKRFGP